MTHQNDWIHGVHHDGSDIYVSSLTPSAGETVTIRLRTPQNAPLNHVYLRNVRDGEPSMQEMKPAETTALSTYWEATITIRQPVTYYSFKLMTDDASYYYNNLGVRRWMSVDDWDFKLLADFAAPEWVFDTIFYQIFPDRFYNGDPSNDVEDNEYSREGHPTVKLEWGEIPWKWEKAGSMDFFGGDLQGIAQKSDYLQALGINGVYLCPIFGAESNHRYDITDFFNVDEHVGGNDGLVTLRRALDEKQMKLMLDVTPNHISFHHPWFLDAQENPDSPTAEFFKRTNGDYEKWLGTTSLIKLNYTSQKLRDVMYRGEDSVLRHWLKEPYRIDAWRLDVANMTGNLGMNQLDHEVHREMRESLKPVKPDLYLIGEHFHDATAHLQGDEIDATMNYQGFNMPIRRWLGGEDLGVADGHAHGDTNLMRSIDAADQMLHFMGAVPFIITLLQFNQLGSHDTTRILHVVKQDKALAQLGAAILLTYPGVPCLYYGDEIGMTGGKDPDNRRCFPWDEGVWDQDLLTYYRQLINIRQQSDALKYGGIQFVYAADDTLAYVRHCRKQTVLVVAHRGDSGATLRLPLFNADIADGRILQDMLSSRSVMVEEGYIQLDSVNHGQAFIMELT